VALIAGVLGVNMVGYWAMPVAASGNLFTLRLRIGVFPVNKSVLLSS